MVLYKSIIIIFLKYPHALKILGLKKEKTSWNGYVSIPSSTGKVSWKRIELNCYKKDDSLKKVCTLYQLAQPGVTSRKEHWWKTKCSIRSNLQV